MNREKNAALAICILVIGVLVVDSVVLFPWEEPSFSWKINISDEFEFNATAYGLIESPDYLAEPIFLSALVDSTIIVKIESLPSCKILSETDFLDIVFTNKVSSRFSNGSVIPSNISATLNCLISRYFMPVGGWNHLDLLFPDTLADVGQHESSCDTYISQLHDTSFIFGHKYYYIDAGDWWLGNVSCSSGIPYMIETSSESYHPPYIFYNWTFRLQLIAY